MGFLVVATDPLHSDFSGEVDELRAIQAEFRTARCKTEEEVAAACQDADGILVTFAPVGRRALAESGHRSGPPCSSLARGRPWLAVSGTQSAPHALPRVSRSAPVHFLGSPGGRMQSGDRGTSEAFGDALD